MNNKRELSIITIIQKSINWFRIIFPKLSAPIYYELPFLLLFIKAIGYSPNIKALYADITSFGVNEAYISFIGHLCISFIFAYIFCTIIYAIKSKPAKWIVKITFYILTLSLIAISYFLLSKFNMTISPMCFILLAETSGKESAEFINQYILSSSIIPTLKITFKYLLAAIVLELAWQYIKNKIEGIRILCCKSLSILIIPILLFGMYHSRIYIKAYNEKQADQIRLMCFPKDYFSSIYHSVLILDIMGQNIKDAITINKDYYNQDSKITINGPINIVVVIGESHIKHHSQIYGYPLETTPNLSKEHQSGRLHIFNDVITSSNSTSVIMKNILCCNNSSDKEDWYEYPTFISIFKKAGYNVYLWDNQRDFDKTATYSFTLNSFLYNPELDSINYTETNQESYNYDEDIIESFKNQVNYNGNNHNLVLFHLAGQHHDVRERFPIESFNKFNADSIKRNEPYLGKEEKAYIADYDNATMYNDYVIHKIIETFRESNSLIIYFSDHGEEVYDYRAQCGRDHSGMSANKLKYQYEIPFVVWCSERFEANYPQKVSSIKNAVNKPFLIDNICNMLFNVAGVDTPAYRDSLDLISPNYKCKDRIINNIYNYEKIRYQ